MLIRNLFILFNFLSGNFWYGFWFNDEVEMCMVRRKFIFLCGRFISIKFYFLCVRFVYGGMD